MSKSNKFKNLLDVTGGILSSLEGLKDQSKQKIKSKIVKAIKNYNLVDREEFNELKAMIISAREGNDKLVKKIKNLENKIKNLK